jgi:hypothetical protein
VVVLVMALFPSYMISKKIFILHMNKQDPVCARWELLFYVSVTLFCIFILVFFLGFPVEDHMLSSRPNGPPLMWRFSTEWQRYIGWMSVIWLIWSVGFGGCIVSRFFEVAWRDSPPRTT